MKNPWTFKYDYGSVVSKGVYMKKNKVSDVIQFLITMLFDENEIIDYDIIKDDREKNMGKLSLTFSDDTEFELQIKQKK